MRLRLTLVYGGLFLVSGAALLAITYLLVRYQILGPVVGRPEVHLGSPPSVPVPTLHADPVAAAAQQAADAQGLLIESGLALAIMALVSIILGWVMAGRVLRPLRTMADTTQQISERSLHQRLAMAGPADELKALGDTIDGLLARLEAAFDAQRRFVANASHELRTPVTLSRTTLEVALADPDLDLASLRTTCAEILTIADDQEQLMEALLTLARSQAEVQRRDTFDLERVAREVLAGHAEEAACRELQISSRLTSALVSGDAGLVRSLLSNLVANAIRHNVRCGRVEVTVGARDGRATIQVRNSGRPVPAGQLDRLLQPFQRVDGDRRAEGAGFGVGLSIVAAVAEAHGATLDLQPFPEGGLDVTVSFPTARAATEPRRIPGD